MTPAHILAKLINMNTQPTTRSDFASLQFRHLGEGANCNAYLDRQNSDDVYLIVEGGDKTKDILIELQGQPHIPKMERIAEDDGYIIYKTEYSESLPDDCDGFTRILSDYGLSDVTSTMVANARLARWIEEDELIPTELKNSIMAVWNRAKELFGTDVFLDMPRRNFGWRNGQIQLRDIIYIHS